jgi:hypothetical protein
MSKIRCAAVQGTHPQLYVRIAWSCRPFFQLQHCASYRILLLRVSLCLPCIRLRRVRAEGNMHTGTRLLCLCCLHCQHMAAVSDGTLCGRKPPSSSRAGSSHLPGLRRTVNNICNSRAIAYLCKRPCTGCRGVRVVLLQVGWCCTTGCSLCMHVVDWWFMKAAHVSCCRALGGTALCLAALFGWWDEWGFAWWLHSAQRGACLVVTALWALGKECWLLNSWLPHTFCMQVKGHDLSMLSAARLLTVMGQMVASVWYR